MDSRWLFWTIGLFLSMLVHGILGREIVRNIDGVKAKSGQVDKHVEHGIRHMLLRYRRQSYPMPNCGSALRSTSDTISSPRYPWKYEENLYCLWKIVVPLKYVIRVEFLQVDITSGKFNLCDLNGDFLLIHDQDRDGPVIGFYCGSNTPPPLISTTNEIWITLHTDGDRIGAGAGFQLSFTAIDPPIITTPVITTSTGEDIDERTTTTVPLADSRDDLLSILGMGNVAVGINREMPRVDNGIGTPELTVQPTTEPSIPDESFSSAASTPPSSIALEPTLKYSSSLAPENSPAMAPEPMPESSTSMEPVPVPEKSPSTTPEPVPEKSPSMTPVPAPEGSPSMDPEPVPESSPSMDPLPVPEKFPSSMAPDPVPENSPSMAPVPLPEKSPSTIPVPVPESSPSMDPVPVPEKSPSSIAPETVSEKSPSMAPVPVPERSPSMAPEPVPESSPSMAPETMPKSSPSMASESIPGNLPSMVPEPIPESSPSSSTMRSDNISMEIPGQQSPYPYDIIDTDGIHKICDEMDSPELSQLETFIAMGQLASDMSSDLPADWQLSAFSPYDSSDTVLAKTFIMNFVIGANILMQTIDIEIEGLMADVGLMDCLQLYSAQLDELLSQFSFLDMPQLGAGPIEMEYDLDLEQEPSEFADTFASDLDFPDDLFSGRKVHWCSSLMTSSSGVIASPNYPMPYPANTVCEWAIPVNPFRSIAIKFTDIDLGPEQNCTLSTDKVIIKVTTIGEPDVKDMYCGSIIPPIIVSQSFSAMVTIKFISHGDVSYKGFQAVYTKVDPGQLLHPGLINFPSLDGSQINPELTNIDPSSSQDNQCSFVHTAPYGIFPPPEFPDVYPPGAICDWNITVAADHMILLNITSFTPLSNNTTACEDPYPYVMVYDIVDGQVVNDISYCGQEDHLALLSSANTILVVLHSSDSYESSFEAYYLTIDASLFEDGSRMILPDELGTTDSPQTVALQQDVSECWEVFIEPSGNFSSPGYPAFYEANIVCTWTILADPLEFIGLKFVDFDVDNAMSNGNCDIRYSYVRVSYFDEEGRIASDQLCGINVALNVTISYSNQMVVYFYSEQGVGTGFLAEYDAFNPDSEIDGAPVFSATNTRIPSTDDNEEDDWYFGASQYNPYNGLSCGEVITISGSVITSPGYPNGYGVNIWCSYVIIAESHQFIQLHFKRDFNVGTSSADGTCFSSRSFVEVSYVDMSGQVTSVYLCGSGAPPITTSYRNQMKVYFSSQHRGQVGFSAEIVFVDSDDEADYIDSSPDEIDINDSYYVSDYESEENETLIPDYESIFCNQRDTDCCYELGRHPFGSIFSPGYPNSYELNTNCTWVIEGEANQIISLVFTDFELDSVVESHADCSASTTHVRVVYFDNQDLTERYYCGHTIPKMTVSDSNLIYVTFHSSDTNQDNDRGFKAIYHVHDKEVDNPDGDSVTGSPHEMATYKDGIFRGLIPVRPLLNTDDLTTSADTETSVTQSAANDDPVNLQTSSKYHVEILTEPIRDTSEIVDLESEQMFTERVTIPPDSSLDRLINDTYLRRTKPTETTIEKVDLEDYEYSSQISEDYSDRDYTGSELMSSDSEAVTPSGEVRTTTDDLTPIHGDAITGGISTAEAQTSDPALSMAVTENSSKGAPISQSASISGNMESNVTSKGNASMSDDIGGTTTTTERQSAIAIDGRLLVGLESNVSSILDATRPTLADEVTGITDDTSVDPESSGDSPIIIGGRFLTFPESDIKAPAGDSPKRGRPEEDSAPMTKSSETSSAPSSTSLKTTSNATSASNSTSDIELSGKGLLPVSEYELDSPLYNASVSDGQDGEEADMGVTPDGRAHMIANAKTRLVTFICIGIGLIFIIILILLLVYCIMTKRHNAESLDLVKERASYWQSYQAFAGHDWPVTDFHGNKIPGVMDAADEETTIMDVRPLGGVTTTFACKPGTPHPRRERLI